MPRETRRKFLSDNFAAATSFGVATAFSGLGHRLAFGESSVSNGKLSPVKDETTGIALLRLPEGFSYRTFGWSKDVMSDGTRTPTSHDGMGVVKEEGDVLTLFRNHEIGDHGAAMTNLRGQAFDGLARGGCTQLRFNTSTGEWLDDKVVLSGTTRNCAGGITPWGTWLTCEESVLGPGDSDPYKLGVVRDFQKEHGWVFEVSPDQSGPATPITSMGRFVHEAVAIDRETGFVYETEDRGTAGFYRFIPNEYGKLSAGGKLEIAEVVGQKDLRGGFENGTTFDVRWHQISDPERAHSPESIEKTDKASDDSTSRRPLGDQLGVFKQGLASGASVFSRLEGCWYGNGLIYFDATDGGAAKAGQIWQYDPKTERLTLLFESPSKPVLNMPDNLCVSPRGGIVLCEDNDYGANEYPQRVFALSQDGKLSLLAENNVQLLGEKNGFKGDFRTKEWAGATFSPDGKWLFINLQSPGITCAITGPWQNTMV